MLNRPETTRRELLKSCLLPALLLGSLTALSARPRRKLIDRFEKQSDLWSAVTGQWFWRKGFVEQAELKKEIGILALSCRLPNSFEAGTRLRIVEGPTFRSAGILFGYHDPDNYAGVYLTSVSTETESFGPKLQLFYREQARDHYPPARLSFPVRNGKWYRLRIQMMGKDFRVFVDDRKALGYSLPPLVGNRLALFAFDARAEFDQFQASW